MDDEPAESLWVSITEQTNMGDILVAVCYRWYEQEEQTDEAFCG